jgi:hypothetical protein
LPRKVAALRYNGGSQESKYYQNLNQLKLGLTKKSLKTIGNPIWARYNSPMIP